MKQTDKEQRWSPPTTTTPPLNKSLKPLTRKQAQFVQELVKNPKQSAAKAAQKVYGRNKTPNINTAAAIASENLTKPNVMLELSKYSQTAELVILEVLEESRKRMKEDKSRAVDWANSARQTADSLLDRVHGKATQKVEQQSTTVTLNIDLTSSLTEATEEK